MPVVGLVILASLFGGIGYGVVRYVGTSAYERMTHYARERFDGDIPAVGDLALAAASPVRDKALRWTDDIDVVAKRASNYPVIDKLAALVDPCNVFHVRFRSMRWEAALETARKCKNAEHEAAALLYLGHYEAAAAKRVRGRDEQEVAAIGAGRWQDAADAARADADSPSGGCRADWYLRMGGFEAPMPQGNTRICDVYAAMEGDAGNRERLMRALAAEQLTVRAKREPGLGMAALDVLGLDGINYFDGTGRRKDETANWLALHAPLRPGDDGVTTRQSRAWVAMMLGLPLHSPHGASSWRHDNLAAEDAMRTGDLRVPLRVGSDFDGTQLRRGIVSGSVFMRCEDYAIATLVIALAGDGRPLAHALAHCAPFRPVHAVRGVAPYLRQGRAELADALRGQHDSFRDLLDWRLPFRLIENLSLYRDTATLLGDHVEAARLQTILLRHAAVLMDRNKAIALALLQRF